MNFQRKLREVSADVRARTVEGIGRLNASLQMIGGAGRELGRLARRHGERFVKQNGNLASAVGQDLSRVARSTYDSLAQRSARAGKPARVRRTPRSRTRAA
jgi:hypothetical protein